MKNSFFSSDSGTSRISSRSKPMILWGTCSSGSHAAISNSIDTLSQNFIKEQHIIWNDTCSQVMVHSVQTVNHCIDLVVIVRDNDLEGTK